MNLLPIFRSCPPPSKGFVEQTSPPVLVKIAQFARDRQECLSYLRPNPQSESASDGCACRWRRKSRCTAPGPRAARKARPRRWVFPSLGTMWTSIDGHGVHAQYRIIVEIGLHHAPAGNRDIAVKRRRQSVNDRALALRHDRWPDSRRGPYPRRKPRGAPSTISLSGSPKFPQPARRNSRNAKSTAMPRKRPAGSGLSHPAFCAASSRTPRWRGALLKQMPAEFVRDLFSGGRQFVHETFAEKSVLRISHRAPEADRDARLGAHRNPPEYWESSREDWRRLRRWSDRDYF